MLALTKSSSSSLPLAPSPSFSIGDDVISSFNAAIQFLPTIIMSVVHTPPPPDCSTTAYFLVMNT